MGSLDLRALLRELREGLGAAELLEDGAACWSLHPSGQHLAASYSSRVCIASASSGANASVQADVEPQIVSVDICSPLASVTAVCWATFCKSRDELLGQQGDCCVLVGTSTGHLYLLSPEGSVLQAQRVHNRPLVKIRCRASGMGIDPMDKLEDITIVAENAVMRLSAIELLSVLRGHRVGGWGETAPDLSVSKWRLPSTVGKRSDALCAGVKPSELYAVLEDEEEEMMCIHTAGRQPPLLGLGAKAQPQDSVHSKASKLAYSVGKQVAAVTSTLRSAYSKGALSGMYSLAKDAVHTASSRAQPQGEEVEVGEETHVWRSLVDPTRAVTSLLPSPSGGLLVAVDQLGRILLLDAPTFAALRIWKGYRNARCGWVGLCPSAPREEQRAQSAEAHMQSDELCLVIHAPRKLVLEVWHVQSGERMCAFRCRQTCLLLQPEPILGSNIHAAGAFAAEGIPSCFVLDVNGRLTNVQDHAASRVSPQADSGSSQEEQPLSASRSGADGAGAGAGAGTS